MPKFVDPISVVDDEGVEHLIASTDGIPVGNATLLQAGTDTVLRLWSAKMIHDEIARQITAAG